jgi:pimeloyl-CoA dehydrogenase
VLPGVASGESRLAWAHDEPAGRHAPLWIETRAERKGGQWALNGAKSPVVGAPVADRLIVTARVAGAAGDPDGCALFLVDKGAPGVDVREFRLVDDSSAGELTLRDAPARPLDDPFDSARAVRAIKATLDIGIAAACAAMVGAAQAAFELATDYLRVRKQFGRFIGENQALRHRAAEMLVSLEMARSMAIAAAVAADDPDGEQSRCDLHRAKLSVGRHARLVAHGAIQLHGGIGMTQEHAVGHYLRHIHVLDQLFGDSDAHAARLAA